MSKSKQETPRFGALAANPEQRRALFYGRVGTTPAELVTKPKHLQEKLVSNPERGRFILREIAANPKQDVEKPNHPPKQRISNRPAWIDVDFKNYVWGKIQ